MGENNKLDYLSEILIPRNVIGPLERFKNYDPTRIETLIIDENVVKNYMTEIHRLESVCEFQRTIEAFQYEVERGLREETPSFKAFEYDLDYRELKFLVHPRVN